MQSVALRKLEKEERYDLFIGKWLAIRGKFWRFYFIICSTFPRWMERRVNKLEKSLK